jgi:uncharacterized membrane protein YqaE (UPF0057 family)
MAINTSEYKTTYIPPYIRRKNKRDGTNVELKKDMLVGSGPIALIFLNIIDFIIQFILKGFKTLSNFFTGGQESINGKDMTDFYSDNEFEHGQVCFDNNYLRHFLTIITPPLGIFMAKGFSGLFTIIISMVLCYINYFIGILYAFLVTYKSKYGDKYAEVQKKIAEKKSKNKDNYCESD